MDIIPKNTWIIPESKDLKTVCFYLTYGGDAND